MAAGYGFRPVQRGGAGYQTAGFIELPIDGDLLGTPIFNGDSVQYNVNTTAATAGIAVNSTPLDNADTLGVLIGAKWVDATGTPRWGQRYDGVSTNTEAMAFVAPAEGTIFKIQATSIVGGWDNKYIGYLNLITAGAGNATTGNSGYTIDLATANGTNAGLVVVGVFDPSDTSLTPEVLVRFIPAAIQQQLG
tara:strand:- start:1169 stop:1744 length:576 start_codon:yes stop_codon:yes gene_type:complete